MIIVVQSLGMGMDAPRGRIIAIAYALKTKGLIDVKKDLCGCSPPGRNQGGSC